MKKLISNRSSYRLLFILFITIITSACAVGNKYQYKPENVGLPIKIEKESVNVSVGTEDAREYVLSNNKPPTFVGLQRGGFGNPFDVNTSSGQPFAADAANVMAGLLSKANFDVENSAMFSSRPSFLQQLKASESDKGIYLNIIEWKTDIYSKMDLHYNLVLTVFDRNGNTLGEATQKGFETLGGASMSQSGNGQKASAALSTKISLLFNDPSIKSLFLKNLKLNNGHCSEAIV